MKLDAISSISKPKLPKAYAYVLHSSQLNNLLVSNSINIHTDLIYWLPQIIGSILEIHYWLPNNKVSYPRLYVRAGALLKADIQTARIIMASKVLPKVGSWLVDIQKQDCSVLYSKTSLYFKAVYDKDNRIVEYIW